MRQVLEHLGVSIQETEMILHHVPSLEALTQISAQQLMMCGVCEQTASAIERFYSI